MGIPFVKMHGTGNDYIFVNLWENSIRNPAYLARVMSERHTGIGSDGLILYGPSRAVDCRMRMFNADGSEGRMCGNGIRCVAKLVYEDGYVKSKDMKIETASGVCSATLLEEKQGNVRVDMGNYQVLKKEQTVYLPDEHELVASYIDIGNRHAVVFVDDLEEIEIGRWGPWLERQPCFGGRVNVEFVQVRSPQLFSMRVWEKGSGETQSCGTGTCASVIAAWEKGMGNQEEETAVTVPGGTLWVGKEGEHVMLTGPAREVFRGEWSGI